MSLLLSGLNPKYLEAIKKFRLIDDTFFNICFDGSVECMQLLLRIFLQRDDITVTEVVTQRSAHNLYGRSVRFDVIAVDSNGKIYNVEIQRADEGANPKRARFNASLIDSREVAKGTEYQDFPEIWVIFITENDILGGGLPMYHVERTITELNHKKFDDATHIAYVNGSYRGSDALGLLMQDFFCSDPTKMHYPELARRTDYFKHESKGVKAMCEIMKQLQDESRAEILTQVTAAIGMLKDNKPVEEITKYTSLSEEELQKLAQQLR